MWALESDKPVFECLGNVVGQNVGQHVGPIYVAVLTSRTFQCDLVWGWASLIAQLVKNPPAMQGTQV